MCSLRGKNCFICALDASKAFDKVERHRLWNKLFDERIEPAVIFAIIAYYDALELIVQNGEEKSARFKTSNGVRQGGILSPKLYNIYSGEMIRKVKSSALGVEIGESPIGIIMYADDLTLIADSAPVLQALLDVAGKQGRADDVKFNAKKSVVMVFNGEKASSEELKFKLNDTDIPISNETRYLGYQLSNNATENEKHINKRQGKVIAKIGQLKALGLISSKLGYKARALIFKAYLRPIINYGIDNCDLSLKDVKLLKKIEANSLKALLGINKEVHSTPIYSALEIEETSVRILKDKIGLFKRLCENCLSRNLLWQVWLEYPERSLINEISSLVNFRCRSQADIDLLNDKLRSEITRISNNAAAVRNLNEKKREVLEVFKEIGQKDYVSKIRKVIGFKVETRSKGINLRNLFEMTNAA